jgi:hypothetical protein
MRTHRGLIAVRRCLFAGAILTGALVLAGCSTGTASSPAPAATSVAPSQSALGAPLPSGFPLIGSWMTAITKDDLRAAGITDPGLLNENSGRFIWTFGQDETWTSIQQSLDGSPVRAPVFRGHYYLEGPILVAVTEFPTEYRDNGLRYRWTYANGEIRFEILDPPDPMLPVVVEAHPWKPAS